jgi:GT2 family glycosyltransferase
MPRISVLTIAAGRQAHLRNLVAGLARQSMPPSEFVIGVMQEELYDTLPVTGFPIRQVRVRPDGTGLPLAKARNAVARAASGEQLMFLDVDCIPHRDFVADYAAHVQSGRGLFMGEVRYLPAGATDGGIDQKKFDRISVRHSERRGPPVEGIDPCNDYRCFWSLNFALHRDDWQRSGGFDERFLGYGGEDTDFGRTLTEKGIPIWWQKGARAYHQHHSHCMPPIHQVDSILHNTEVFARKWGHRTMEHWLRAFRLMGLIEHTPEGLRAVRKPTEAEFELCQQKAHQPYANSDSVLRLLEERAANRQAQSSIAAE